MAEAVRVFLVIHFSVGGPENLIAVDNIGEGGFDASAILAAFSPGRRQIGRDSASVTSSCTGRNKQKFNWLWQFYWICLK